MKICALIAEYNPFHLGHLKHIDYIKNTLGAQSVIVVMSGNFTQRGDVAVLDKFTRARHALLAGADMVIELPTVFATSNAETFATGGVNIIDALGVCDAMCFGVESGDKTAYLSLAKAMLNETKEFKKILKEKLDGGISLAKAKFETVKQVYGDVFDHNLIALPNNILGLEYTKALIRNNSNVDIHPMIRLGDHNDVTLKKGVTSATSIRQVLKTGKIKRLKKCVPSFVYKDFTTYPFLFEKLVLSEAVRVDSNDLAKITDCTEGLENRIKAFVKDNSSLEMLVDKISTKRYTKTRIQRILTANLLGINAKLVQDAKDSPTYAKVLAIKKESMDLIPLLCKNSSIPILTRKSDEQALRKTAKKCFEKDVLANDLYSLITGTKTNEHQMLIV